MTRANVLFRHGGLYAASSLAAAALSFLVLPVYVAWLGPEGLGQVEVLQVGVTALMLLLAQGLPAAWFRQRLEHQGPARRQFESVVIAYLSCVLLAVLAASMLFGPGLARWLTPQVPFYPLWLLSIALAGLNVLADVYASGLQAESRSGAYALFVVGRRVVSIALALFLIVQARWGVLGKVAGETLTALGFALSVLVWLRPPLPAASSRPLLTAALAYGWPLLPHSLAMMTIAVFDRFVLSHALGLQAVGVYALGYRIASVLEAVNGGFGNAYRALFMSSAAEVERGAQPRQRVAAVLAGLELKLLAAVSFCAQGLSCATRDLLELARVDMWVFASTWRVAYVVCWGLIAHAAYALLATPLLYAQRATSRMSWISGTAALLNVALCVVLVPRLGLLAAAWATAASHVCLALGAWLAGRRIWPLPRSVVRWAALFLWHTLLICSAYQLDASVETWPVRIAAKLGLLLLSAGVLSYMLRRY
jgi:O-antigen/teichoic acid export membrane protein